MAEILTLSVLTAERKASIIHRADIKDEMKLHKFSVLTIQSKEAKSLKNLINEL